MVLHYIETMKVLKSCKKITWGARASSIIYTCITLFGRIRCGSISSLFQILFSFVSSSILQITRLYAPKLLDHYPFLGNWAKANTTTYFSRAKNWLNRGVGG